MGTTIQIPRGLKSALTALASSSGLHEAELYYVTDETAVYIGTSATTYALVGTTDHTALSNIGTNTHAQIDTHISNTSNPHTVTASQVGNGTAQWNADKLQGVAISSTAPADTEVLTYNATTSEWEAAAAGGGSSGWGLSGNAISSGDFFGTTNDQDIVLKRNNISYGKIGRSTGIGYQALNSDDGTDNNNVAFGYQCLYSNTSGSNNVAVGLQAMYNCVNGYSGVAIGNGAMYTATYPQRDVAIGETALYNIVRGGYHIAIGYMALYTVGNYQYNNIGIGAGAGYTFGGSAGMFIGRDAGYYATGNYNTLIGYQAGNLITSGSSNTILGYDADVGTNSDSNCIILGKSVTGTASNQVRLGDSAITTMYCYGAYAATTASGANVYVDANGKIQRSTSSRRYKTNIVNLETDTNKLYQLNPVTFTEKATNEKNFGLIAEDVAKILPELVIYAKKSDVIPEIKTERIKQENKERIAKQILSVRAEKLKEEDAEREKELTKEETKLKAETDKITVGEIDNTLIPEAVDYSKLSVLLLNEMKQMRAEIDKLKAVQDGSENR